jgi:hypothetical protein
MKVYPVLFRFLFVPLLASLFFLHKALPDAKKGSLTINQQAKIAFEKEEGEEEEKSEERAKYNAGRLRHEYQMLRNPVTGKIPANFRQVELRAASRIPVRRRLNDPRITGLNGTAVQNQYDNIGPNNVAGRSRTLAIDRRNPSIMLTGGTTGGIFRSTNGGDSWNFVMNENDIRSANTIVQDPTNPDVWYCGTGEVFYPPSESDISHGTFGWGIFKSIDNGVTWTKLPATATDSQHEFSNPYDLVHRLAIHPTTGHIYGAIHRRIVRSTNGGLSWETVLGGNVLTTIFGGITDVLISSNGTKIYAAISGENTDRSLTGVWESTTGNVGGWRRIAGGASGQTDSVAGWQPFGQWGRAVLALNSTNSQLFVLYKNDEDAAGNSPKPEADLFRCNVSTGNPATYTWTNLNGYVPDEPGFNFPGIDPYTTQFNGYNMSITVKPDNDNILFIGGTAMHRVHLNETDAARKFRRIGGYGSGFFPQPQNFIYPNHHPDVHWILFSPTSNDRLYTASDGGIHLTNNSVLADTVRWNDLDSNLQTIQYQTISIVPEPDLDFVVGGTQDNGTLLSLNPETGFHQQIGGGDGATSAISTFRKTGNTWKQSIFLSVVQGSIYRINLDWQFDPTANSLDLTGSEDDEITPASLGGQGQWVTLFANDQDSTEHVYYNSKNKIYRTKTASTVTSTTWTELTGVGNTVASDEDVSAMMLSQRGNGTKYLYFGTNGGKMYRLNNANTVTSTRPINITPPTMAAGSYVAGISVNPRNADTVLAVVSNYDQGASVINNIFWTGNATAANPTWQVLDNTLAPVSSQSCAIVVKTTGVEYYVGTSVGLYSTTAINGNSTAWFNEGTGIMKTAIIRALMNRQKDNTLVVGTHGNGAFISHLGNAVNLDVVTRLPDPITNDKWFIKAVYPTVSSGRVQYQIGNLFTVKRLLVQLYNVKGQLVYQQQGGYQNGSVDLQPYARGQYILSIYSDDRKYRHIQKLIRE